MCWQVRVTTKIIRSSESCGLWLESNRDGVGRGWCMGISVPFPFSLTIWVHLFNNVEELQGFQSGIVLQASSFWNSPYYQLIQLFVKDQFLNNTKIKKYKQFM